MSTRHMPLKEFRSTPTLNPLFQTKLENFLNILYGYQMIHPLLLLKRTAFLQGQAIKFFNLQNHLQLESIIVHLLLPLPT